jgi:hypothetical protein
MDYRRYISEFEQSSHPLQTMVDTVAKANAKLQAEATTLIARRSQAWLELPGRAAQCRSPQDVMQLQARFWQTYWQNYTDAGRSMSEALMPVWAPLLSGATQMQAHGSGNWLPWQIQSAPQRDVMDVRSPRETPADTQGSRRAA